MRLACGIPVVLTVLAAQVAQARDAGDEARLVLFGSLEGGRAAFLAAGAKYAPDGLDRDGFVAMPCLGYGLRPERDPAPPATPRAPPEPPRILRHTVLAGGVAGWQWLPGWGAAGLFAGPEASFEVLDSAAARRLPAPRFGVRLQAELWARLSAASLLTATLVAGTARGSVWARLSWGIRLAGSVLGDAYLGPETSLYAERGGYRALRLGLHATEIAVGPANLTASGGLALVEKVRHPGFYATLTAWLRL